jgi:putative pyoverdin transport system ATP-binding/permease protein
MTIIRLFRQHLASHWVRFLMFAALSGLSSATVLASINTAANNLHDRDVVIRWLIILILSILIYAVSQKGLMLLAANVAENFVQQMRVVFLTRLNSAELPEIEALNRGELYSCLSSEMQAISDGALQLMVIGQALVLIIITMAYLAFISLPALFIAAFFVAIAVSFYLACFRQLNSELRESFVLQTRLMELFTDFVEGFKEVKLSIGRSTELANEISQLASVLATKRLSIAYLHTKAYISGQITFFLLPGTIVFVVPMFIQVSAQTVVMMTTSVLFLIGPITAVVGGLPIVQRVNSAAESILLVQNRLSQIGKAPTESQFTLAGFDQIELNDVSYKYPGSGGERGFSMEPVNLLINRGRVVFITGGNGSGKSTLLKLITGLYGPSSGVIKLDGYNIDRQNIDLYRSLFSAIFSDYHLFKKLYGLPEFRPEDTAKLFQLLEIEGKSHIAGRTFSTVALSSGQRKRLAMIALMLEDKPICVFDEWAADQDPHFREKFYREILPLLRAAGKTVIAVTHDDRYFDVADVQLHLEEGRVQPIA